MKFTEKKAIQPLEILKYDHFVAVASQISDTGVTADASGKKLVKAGTILPSNDASAKGVLLTDVDVTHGAANGTLVIHGFIDNAKLVKNGITVTEAAVTALPMIQFVGYSGTQA